MACLLPMGNPGTSVEGEDIGTVHGEPYDVEINNHYS